MYDLKGKVALVTGAAGEHGMGHAIATRLAQEGADVVVNDVAQNRYAVPASGWGGIPQVVREIEDLGTRAMGVIADITDSPQVENMVNQALERFGHIDILVNNAAARPGRDRAPVVELAQDAWEAVLRVNLTGTFLCSKAVGREMVRRGQGGKIIIISSTAGKRGVARSAAYSASKFGLIGFTQALALELAPYQINVNAICPGWVETDRTEDLTMAFLPQGESLEEFRIRRARDATRGIPLGRVAVGSDIAKVAAFLASAESDWLTGLAISVSGGAVMD